MTQPLRQPCFASTTEDKRLSDGADGPDRGEGGARRPIVRRIPSSVACTAVRCRFPAHPYSPRRGDSVVTAARAGSGKG